MKYYLAGDYRDRFFVGRVGQMLEEATAGLACTFKWWYVEPAPGNDQATMDDKVARERLAAREAQAVRDADVVLAIGPGRRGMATELGIAIGLGKRIVVWMPKEADWTRRSDGFDSANLFLFHPSVERVTGGSAALALAKALDPLRQALRANLPDGGIQLQGQTQHPRTAPSEERSPS
jgi:hypothetical protein